MDKRINLKIYTSKLIQFQKIIKNHIFSIGRRKKFT